MKTLKNMSGKKTPYQETSNLILRRKKEMAKELFNNAIRPIVLIVMLFIVILMMLSSCSVGDKDEYDTAIIYVGGEWITVEIESWSYAADDGRIELKSKDGKTYHVDSMNITLIDSDNN